MGSPFLFWRSFKNHAKTKRDFEGNMNSETLAISCDSVDLLYDIWYNISEDINIGWRVYGNSV